MKSKSGSDKGKKATKGESKVWGGSGQNASEKRAAMMADGFKKAIKGKK